MVGFLLGGKLTRSSLKGHTGVSFSISICAALLPALVAANRFPEYRQIILPIVIASTVVFEIIGPVFTRLAIHRASRD